LIFGNSFSAAFTQAFDKLVQDKNYAVTVTSSWGASPIKEIPNKGEWDKANDFYWSSTVPNLIRQLREGDIVFLINDMVEFSPKKKTSETAKKLQLLETGLMRFSSELKEQGVTLAILNGNPFAREASCKPESAIKQWYSPFGSKKCEIPDRETTLERRKSLDEVLNRVSLASGVKVVDLLGVFCPLAACNYHASDGSILYRDERSHPSVEAAKLSGEVFFRQFTDH
jgi:hypothetical protein